METKAKTVMDKLSHTDLKVSQAKEKLRNDLVMKQHNHFMKNVDRRDNVERID